MQKEQPKLFQRRLQLVQQQNKFTIQLAELEDTLLREIASAEARGEKIFLRSLCRAEQRWLMFQSDSVCLRSGRRARKLGVDSEFRKDKASYD